MIQAEVSIGFHGLAGELIVPDAQASRTATLFAIELPDGARCEGGNGVSAFTFGLHTPHQDRTEGRHALDR
jgi:hypothetical protein